MVDTGHNMFKVQFRTALGVTETEVINKLKGLTGFEIVSIGGVETLTTLKGGKTYTYKEAKRQD